MDLLQALAPASPPEEKTSTPTCTTIHIAGLPPNATARELYLLLVALPGFEHAKLVFDTKGTMTGDKVTKKHPVAFAKFDSIANADYAKTVLSQVCYEWGSGYPLHVMYASQPSRVIRKDKKVESNETGHVPGAAAALHANRFSPFMTSGVAYPTDLPLGRVAGTGMATGVSMSGGDPEQKERPCTLFCESTNGVQLVEEKMRHLTSLYPGIVKITCRGQRSWIKFATHEEALQALNLNGFCGEVIDNASLKVAFARTDTRKE